MGIQFTGLASGLDTQSIIADLMEVENIKVEKVEKQKTKAEWKKDAWEEMNSKLYSFYKNELFKFKSYGTYNKKSVTSSNESVVTATATNSAVTGTHTVNVTQMAKGSFLTGSEITDSSGNEVTSSTLASELMTFTGDTASFQIRLNGSDAFSEVTIEQTDTVADIVSKIEDLGLDLNVNYDTNFDRMFLSSENTGEGVQLEIDGDDALLSALGFDTTNRTGSVGQDAIFEYNGTELTSSSNEVTVNGLDMSICGEGQTVSISVNDNSDEVYESIKNFISKYNELMTEINEKLDADSSYGYDPLTADEKDAMTDAEIESWEAKIKDSLLRNDDILSNVQYSIRSTLTSSLDVDTSSLNYSFLSDLGIVTGSYTEQGMLHIEGDEDDDLYSVKDNKLKQAIEDDPEGVADFFSELGQTLYDKMTNSMKSTTLSSALTFYNDKFIDNQISDYEDEIDDLEDRLTTIEERYYAQFTAMEQAIQEANSTADWLSQQFA